MTTEARWCVIAGVACMIAGVALSRRIEPRVYVETVTLAGNTPALRFQAGSSATNRVVLLAHGWSASKESLFRYGEALAAAGFVCYSVDLPGHGASRRRFSVSEVIHTIERIAPSLRTVDVFLGHSMGAHAGGIAVSNQRLRPRLFIAIGSQPRLGEHGIPLLYLVGKFEECFSPATLKEGTNARVVISPWSDHALEPFDPYLVNAAIREACAAVGMSPPAPPTQWRWRLAGVLLGVLGAFSVALSLPKIYLGLMPARGVLLPVFVIVALTLTLDTWLGAVPHLRRIPQMIVSLAIALAVIPGAAKLRIPRWVFFAIAASVAVGCFLAGATKLGFFVSLFALILLTGTVLGAIVARGGPSRDGDVAMAIFVGYALGQWIPVIL